MLYHRKGSSKLFSAADLSTRFFLCRSVSTVYKPMSQEKIKSVFHCLKNAQHKYHGYGTLLESKKCILARKNGPLSSNNRSPGIGSGLRVEFSTSNEHGEPTDVVSWQCGIRPPSSCEAVRFHTTIYLDDVTESCQGAVNAACFL